jgi:hypothetical protein
VARKLSCYIGRHAWTVKSEHGEEYTVCSNCGKIQSGPRKPISEEDVSWGKGGPGVGL